MVEGRKAVIKMKMPILSDMPLDETEYEASLISENEETENLVFSVADGSLPKLTQDARYIISFFPDETISYLEEYEGVIVDRYINKQGASVVIHIKKGRYLR